MFRHGSKRLLVVSALALFLFGCRKPAPKTKDAYSASHVFRFTQPAQTKPATELPGGPRVEFVDPTRDFHGQCPPGSLQIYRNWFVVRHTFANLRTVPHYYFLDLDLNQITPPWLPPVSVDENGERWPTHQGRLTPFDSFVTFERSAPLIDAGTSRTAHVYNLISLESTKVELQPNAWTERMALDGNRIVQVTGGDNEPLKFHVFSFEEDSEPTAWKLPKDRRIPDEKRVRAEASPEWDLSPDGKQIVFAGPWLSQNTDTARLDIFNAETGEVVNSYSKFGIPNPPQNRAGREISTNDLPITVSRPKFSADGRLVNYRLRYGDNAASTRYLQMDIRSGTTGERLFPVFENDAPDFTRETPLQLSTDGQSVLWARHPVMHREWEISVRTRGGDVIVDWQEVPGHVVPTKAIRIAAKMLPDDTSIIFVNEETRTGWWFNWTKNTFEKFAKTDVPNGNVDIFATTPKSVGFLRLSRAGTISCTVFEP